MLRFVGCDVHKRTAVFSILLEDGRLLATYTVPVTREALKAFAERQLGSEDRLDGLRQAPKPYSKRGALFILRLRPLKWFNLDIPATKRALIKRRSMVENTSFQPITPRRVCRR
jgi:hypothetical protein